MLLISTWAQVPAEAGGVHCCCFRTLNPIKKKVYHIQVTHLGLSLGEPFPAGRVLFFLFFCFLFFIMKLLSLGDWLSVGGSSLLHTM